MKRTVSKLFLFVVLASALPANAKEPSFEDARAAAFSGRRPEAIALCEQLLAKDPNDSEARTLLGRLFAWSDRYDKAREQFQFVLAAKPDAVDARAGLIDAELWSDHAEAALARADEGLKLNASSTVLLMKRATALRKLGRPDEALGSAQRAMDVAPENLEAQDFIKAVNKENALYKASLSYTHDALTEGFDPWDQVSLSLSRQFSFGSVVARMNRANRFKTDGTQFEVDAYPHLREGTYFYLNAGISSDSIFPKARYGFEAYQSFGNGYEGSIGMRYLEFSSSIVRILTASLGKYLGNYYFLGRINVVPDSSGTSVSGRIQVRRYFGDENYLQLAFGGGRSPTYASSGTDIVVLRSNSASLDFYHSISALWFGSLGVGYSNDEIRSDIFRGDWSLNAGLEKRF